MPAVMSLDLVDCFRSITAIGVVLEYQSSELSALEIAHLNALEKRLREAVLAEAKMRVAAGMEALTKDEILRLDTGVLADALSLAHEVSGRAGK